MDIISDITIGVVVAVLVGGPISYYMSLICARTVLFYTCRGEVISYIGTIPTEYETLASFYETRGAYGGLEGAVAKFIVQGHKDAFNRTSDLRNKINKAVYDNAKSTEGLPDKSRNKSFVKMLEQNYQIWLKEAVLIKPAKKEIFMPWHLY